MGSNRFVPTDDVFPIIKSPRAQVNKPLSKLEGDLGRLTSALTSEGDAQDAAGLQKPLFSLCADGYLLCDPQ